LTLTPASTFTRTSLNRYRHLEVAPDVFFIFQCTTDVAQSVNTR
jgi:hypothetical protein